MNVSNEEALTIFGEVLTHQVWEGKGSLYKVAGINQLILSDPYKGIKK